MKNILISAICGCVLGMLTFVPAAQAGSPGPQFQCYESGDSSVEDYFCDDGKLYEVTVNCSNLIAGIRGNLRVTPWALSSGSGRWNFEVIQGTSELSEPSQWDPVCRGYGIYGDSKKTELKCTDAEKGPNKDGGYAQADFEIKYVGACP